MEIGVLIFFPALQRSFLYPTLAITELDPFGNCFLLY